MILYFKRIFDVCKNIKQEKKLATIPIIMLTAKGEETDRIIGRIFPAVWETSAIMLTVGTNVQTLLWKTRLIPIQTDMQKYLYRYQRPHLA